MVPTLALILTVAAGCSSKQTANPAIIAKDKAAVATHRSILARVNRQLEAHFPDPSAADHLRNVADTYQRKLLIAQNRLKADQ